MTNRLLMKHSAGSPDAVASFVETRRPLRRVLLDLAAEIRKHFGVVVPRLDLEHDPETHRTTIFVVVPWLDNVAASQRALDELESTWWLDHSDDARGLVYVRLGTTKGGHSLDEVLKRIEEREVAKRLPRTALRPRSDGRQER